MFLNMLLVYEKDIAQNYASAFRLVRLMQEYLYTILIL